MVQQAYPGQDPPGKPGTNKKAITPATEARFSPAVFPFLLQENKETYHYKK